MLPLVTLVFGMLAASSGPPAQADSPREPGGATTELQQPTQQRFDANAANDRAFYERLLAPTFLLLEPCAYPPHTKDAYLKAEFPENRAPRPESAITEFQAIVEGDTAVFAASPGSSGWRLSQTWEPA